MGFERSSSRFSITASQIYQLIVDPIDARRQLNDAQNKETYIYYKG